MRDKNQMESGSTFTVVCDQTGDTGHCESPEHALVAARTLMDDAMDAHADRLTVSFYTNDVPVNSGVSRADVLANLARLGFGATKVTLTFELDEEVTPEIFAGKIAVACAKGGALRVGEAVSAGGRRYEYADDKPIDLFDNGNTIMLPSFNETEVSR